MDSVVFSEHATGDGRRIMRVRLNAPRSLNALSLEMIRLLQPQLDRWADDDMVAAVWLEGSGDKAFCAGGDVLALYRAMVEDQPEQGDAFFREEYRLDYRIHTYPKPIIVWGDGIIMGGGLGLMAGATFRVVTEKAHIAMPEIGIGLFPDVGGSWFLNRMPGRTGLFLGLTGMALNAADAIFLGLADRFIPQEQRESTFEAIVAATWSSAESANTTVSRTLRACESEFIAQLPESAVGSRFDQIQALTDADTVSELAARLTRYEGEDPWFNKAARNVAQGSPSSFALFYKQLESTRHSSLAEVFRLELVMAYHALRQGEFAEGVRALLVDKDRQPRWRYPALAEVDAGWIEEFFVSPWSLTEHPLRDLS